VGTKFAIFRNFLDFFGAITVKTASFSVQTVKFVFKRLNFNSNKPITSCRVTTALRPQRQVVVPTLTPSRYRPAQLQRGR
jgi:hypothetical protein